MVRFFLENLFLLAAWLLAGLPYLLAVINFRRRLDVKLRALSNLLCDPEVLRQYKDQFPSRKTLDCAQNLADHYFETFYNYYEYMAGLALNFVTGGVALVFVLAKAGFPVPFMRAQNIQFIQNASWSTAVLWAIIGGYLWNCYDLISRTTNFDLAPDTFSKMWLKLWVASAVAAILSEGVSAGLHPSLGFAVGLISIPVLFEAIADKAGRVLNIKTVQADTSAPIRLLQGATPDVIDRLSDIDISSTVQLAYCDPLHVMMTSNLSWAMILDLINQALLFNYVGPDAVRIRSGGYRGAIELAVIGANLNGTPEQRTIGVRSLSDVATMLQYPEQKVLDLVQTLYDDGQVNLIWDLMGGKYRGRDKAKTPDIAHPSPIIMSQATPEVQKAAA
jgi:hypothetical protein